MAPSRLRTVVAAIVPTVGALATLSPLLDVFRATDVLYPSIAALVSAAKHAGRSSLLSCAVVFVVFSVLAAIDGRVKPPQWSARRLRLLGTLAAVAALAAAIAGGVAATHGHPFPFVKRQWNGFTHPEGSSSSSHFSVVGSGSRPSWRS